MASISDSKEIRFSNESLYSCVGFIDLVDSTKNIIVMDKIEHIRKYYSEFINPISQIIKRYEGKIIKNIGDGLLFYFPKISKYNDNYYDKKSMNYFKHVIECCFKILDERYRINNELSKLHLPPYNYRISMDYGVVDLALAGDNNQIDLFGSTINLCSKINTSSLAIPNEVIIGDNFYRFLQFYPDIVNNYTFQKNGECKITETINYPSYSLKRKNIVTLSQSTDCYNVNYYNEEKLEHKQKEKKNKRLIIVDDDEEILLTYKLFLDGYNYQVSSFSDPLLALDYIRKMPNFNDLLVILDIRMENLNGIQLHQQIKAIDPTIKILFVTILDIVEELLTIVPGLSKDQILRKPVNKKKFTDTVEQLSLN